MGVRFRWHSDDPSGVVPPEPPPHRRRARMLTILLIALVAACAGIHWRTRQGLAAARADLQAQVDREVLALQAGQLDALFEVLDGRYAPWLRYHQQCFARESAWYAARPGARVVVEAVQLSSDRAVAQVRLWEGAVRTGRSSQWYFRRVDGEWRHTPPTLDAWGMPASFETEHLCLVAQGPDRELVTRLLPNLEALRTGLLHLYGPAPQATGPTGRITIRVLPYGASTEGGNIIPSPHLALELWSAAERRSVLSRDLRVAVARAVVSSLLGRSHPRPGDWWLVEALAAFHAGAWVPEWQATLRQSLADGSYRQYLTFEAYGAISRARELRSLPPDTQRAQPLAYTLGELLTTRYPSGQIRALLETIAAGSSSWAAVESVLGADRSALEAAWRLYLQERYGP